MRFTDIIMGFPSLLLLIALSTALEGKVGEMVGLLDALRVEREKEE